MRRLFLHTLAALLPTVVLAATASAPVPVVAPPGSGPECEALAGLKLADTTISSSKAVAAGPFTPPGGRGGRGPAGGVRSEEHTFELQSHSELVCRLLL